MAQRGSLVGALVTLLVTAAALAQPSPRGYVDMVYVPQVEKVLLFGGQQGFVADHQALGGTWWYDPATGAWTEVTTEPQPSPRSAANLAVHEPTGTVVMFGGGVGVAGGFEALTETWLFDPVQETWTLLSFAEGETPRAEVGEQFAYHAAADVFVLYGGLTLNPMSYLDATWHFDLEERAWTRADPATVPPGRNFNTFAYDPRTERLVMTGGPDAPDAVDEVWTYDPRTEDWSGSERTPPADVTAYARMVYDTVTDALIRFGGHGEPAGTAWSLSADLEWTLLEPEGDGPRPISRHAMTAVPGLGVLIFGGVPRGSPDFSADLWLLDTREMRWEQR